MKWCRNFLMAAFIASAAAETPFIGVDANYSLGMEKEGKSWSWDGKKRDLFEGMAKSGVHGFRVRLWVGDEGAHGKIESTSVVKRALAAGLDPYLVIFLSEDWADLMKQPAPKIWADLDLKARAAAVKDYSREMVTHFRSEGLKSHLYEIGNEIDYGICGVYPGKSTKKSPESLSKKCWPEAVELIKASQAGVLEADPEAKFLLHIAHWWDVEFVNGFFKFMKENAARVDYAGLSYFPSSNIGGSLEMGQFLDVAKRLNELTNVPVIVPEVAYPSTADFKGQFSRWKKETPGYPLTPDGQRRWVSDFLDACAKTPAIAGVYYWSPEWCGEGMWKGMAFFDPDGSARPAWSAFAKPRAERSAPKSSVFLEVRDGKVHAVPVATAREKAAPVLAEKLAKAGRVNVDYIKDITDSVLVVDGYRVILRASLSGNLDLALQPDAPVADAKAVIDKMDPAAQRLMVFAVNPEDRVVAETLAVASQRGVEVVVHPVADDKPLKFGLGGTKADSAY
ncbi:glycosyl hydrolase 53 family protein [Luteolibacter soli]|uniref:Arabinogalactan endo-beta-1,4-galactanase n=1 Tax=Luteolibacter soli TaxID=3135280 RepID=A0ABU9B0X7_9BACT